MALLPQTIPPDAFVSVILAIRNEANFIESTLTAILNQDYPRNRMELVIADGQSTDATPKAIATVVAQNPGMVVKVVENPGKIVSPGLNAAIEAARGEVIVRVDGHTIIERDYVTECVEALRRSGAQNVGGRMDPVGSTPFGKAVALATSSPFGVGGARFHYSDREEWVDTVYLGCWPRAIFDAIGGFDEEQVRNQDDELNYRLRERGGKVLLSPRIRSRYFNRGTVGSLWRQYFEYGLWKVRVMQKHPLQMQWRQFVPGLFVLGLTVLAVSAPWVGAARILLAGVVGVYVTGAILAGARAAGMANPGLTARVAFAFGVLHVGYGLGFLGGLVRFWNRWGGG